MQREKTKPLAPKVDAFVVAVARPCCNRHPGFPVAGNGVEVSFPTGRSRMSPSKESRPGLLVAGNGVAVSLPTRCSRTSPSKEGRRRRSVVGVVNPSSPLLPL
ncbi:hypothetical protein PIB30_019110 [Stylosanthes scabra]|uniref:Uncharacterized protein n=1 Tax=Stylosanthes scabra TaxID=79078 RepID=A0ABU6V694_9FABA|nr:hypothetical protein [Stylosanthes scabra]